MRPWCVIHSQTREPLRNYAGKKRCGMANLMVFGIRAVARRLLKGASTDGPPSIGIESEEKKQ
jgi:hypothetical protein